NAGRRGWTTTPPTIPTFRWKWRTPPRSSRSRRGSGPAARPAHDPGDATRHRPARDPRPGARPQRRAQPRVRGADAGPSAGPARILVRGCVARGATRTARARGRIRRAVVRAGLLCAVPPARRRRRALGLDIRALRRLPARVATGARALAGNAGAGPAPHAVVGARHRAVA